MGARGVAPRPATERFWEKVTGNEDPQSCWLWIAATDPTGHGRFQTGTRTRQHVVSAHRFAYEEIIGAIPEGLHLHHRCEQPRCVNPTHMEVVTHAEHKQRHRRTHCHRGHVIIDLPSGRRRCRECHAQQERERKERRRV